MNEIMRGSDGRTNEQTTTRTVNAVEYEDAEDAEDDEDDGYDKRRRLFGYEFERMYCVLHVPHSVFCGECENLYKVVNLFANKNENIIFIHVCIMFYSAQRKRVTG